MTENPTKSCFSTFFDMFALKLGTCGPPDGSKVKAEGI